MRSLRVVAVTAFVVLSACDDPARDEAPGRMDFGHVDAAASDAADAGAGEEDAGDADAGPSATCVSPEDRSLLEKDRRAPGCACEATPQNQAGYCFGDTGLECWDGRWVAVLDGPCFPPGYLSPAMCEERGGEQLPPLPDRPDLDYRREGVCPDGRELLGAIFLELFVEARCCKRP